MFSLKVKSFYKKATLVGVGLIMGVLFSILIDQVLGIYLNKTGYFKALAPNVTDIFQTSEFSISSHVSWQGIRNEVVVLPKPKEVYRILALGDSFTFGWGGKLEQSWPKQLQGLIKIPGRNLEIINAGVPGAGPKDYLKICKAYTDYLDADTVIIGFFSTNDLYQAVEKEKKPFWPTLVNIANPILTKWHFDAIAGDIFYLSDIWQKQAEKITLDHPDLESRLDSQIFNEFRLGKLNPAVVIPGLADPNYLVRFLDPQNFNSEIVAFDHILGKIKKECIGNRPAILVFIPSYELISEDYFKYRSAQGYIVDKKLIQFDLDLPFKKIALKNGFKYISLLSDFRKDKCIGCYYPQDTHLTPLGQRKVAEIVAKNFQMKPEDK